MESWGSSPIVPMPAPPSPVIDMIFDKFLAAMRIVTSNRTFVTIIKFQFKDLLRTATSIPRLRVYPSGLFMHGISTRRCCAAGPSFPLSSPHHLSTLICSPWFRQPMPTASQLPVEFVPLSTQDYNPMVGRCRILPRCCTNHPFTW